MRDKQRHQHQLEMLFSLHSAVLAVGGNPSSIIWLDMTLEDMLDILAQNGVRFCVKEK